MGRKLLLAAITGAWILAMVALWIWFGLECNFGREAAGWYWGLTWILLATIIAIPIGVYNDADSNKKETSLEEIYG